MSSPDKGTTMRSMSNHKGSCLRQWSLPHSAPPGKRPSESGRWACCVSGAVHRLIGRKDADEPKEEFAASLRWSWTRLELVRLGGRRQ